LRRPIEYATVFDDISQSVYGIAVMAHTTDDVFDHRCFVVIAKLTTPDAAQFAVEDIEHIAVGSNRFFKRQSLRNAIVAA
jgi:hypothetical protein